MATAAAPAAAVAETSSKQRKMAWRRETGVAEHRNESVAKAAARSGESESNNGVWQSISERRKRRKTKENNQQKAAVIGENISSSRK